MSRVEEVIGNLERANDGGMSHDEWILQHLTEISITLARLVDVMDEKERTDERIHQPTDGD